MSKKPEQIDLEHQLPWVEMTPDAFGVVLPPPSPEALLVAGWSDDPHTGKAVLALDERGNPAYEVLNPIPIAPPIGFVPTPPIEELIRQRVAAAVATQLAAAGIGGDDVIDTEEDVNDFDIPDELPPLETAYEVLGMETEVPPLLPPRDKADNGAPSNSGPPAADAGGNGTEPTAPPVHQSK